MLRAAWRVLRPGGHLAFITIFISRGLSERDYRRAARARSPGVTAWRRDHADLLRAARFTDVESTDLTADFLRVARGWLEARTRHREELIRVLGEQDFARRLNEGRATVRAIEDGLLQRALFVARRQP